MKTLYELLGTLTDDDAESLRAAFREAAKGAHPDLNPNDPDAALKFRQIVRANEILSDEQQRAAYDHLLDLACLEQEAASERGNAVPIYWIATGIMALASIGIVSLGGYLLLGHLALAQMADALGGKAGRAGAAIGLSNTFDRTEQRDKLEEVVTPGVVASELTASAPASSDDVPVGDFGIKDAQHFRRRGIIAYRSGDLYLALANFNLAINFDPSFSEAYLDRAIVFHRIGDPQRAFDDIAEAKRIDGLKSK